MKEPIKPNNRQGELVEILNDAMTNLKHVIDINTVVGQPINSPDGSVIIPVSKVYVGLVSGGGELSNKTSKVSHNFSYPFAGGTGAGFTVLPIGFLVTKNDTTTFVNTEVDKSTERLVEMANRTLQILIENLKKE